MDGNVPQSCPCTGNTELWQAVRFQRDTRTYEQKTYRKMKDTWYKIAPQKETPQNRLTTPGEKQIFERTPRATHCTDRAQSSPIVSGRAFLAKIHSFSSNGARTKRCDRKQTKKNHNYTLIYIIVLKSTGGDSDLRVMLIIFCFFCLTICDHRICILIG